MDDNGHYCRTVLMTADTVGGVWTYTIDLCRALNPYGIDVALATMGAGMSADQREEARACPNVEVFESEYRLEWMDDPWDDVRRAGEWLLAIARDVRPDVVHLNGFAHGRLRWEVPVVMMAHSCVLSWWEAVRRESAPPAWNRYRSEVTAGLRAADIVAAPSRAMLASIEKHYGRLQNGRVIPNGRDAVLYDSLGPKEPFVLAAGRVWDEAKNIAALADAATGVIWPVVVAGDDLHPDGSRRALDNVTALGRIAPRELSEWFANASIYALPARYEPFGLSVLEAALSRCALVLGDIPSLRENWDAAALFVDPHDANQLRATINLLIRKDELRRALADRGYERARQFTAERMAGCWRDAYESACAAEEVHSCA